MQIQRMDTTRICACMQLVVSEFIQTEGNIAS